MKGEGKDGKKQWKEKIGKEERRQKEWVNMDEKSKERKY